MVELIKARCIDLNLLRKEKTEYIRGEHTRGTEEEVMVSSQIEVMEQQRFLF
jgi:hypothetical protein